MDGKEIKKALKEQGRTIEWLAAKMGVTRQALGVKIKAGRFTNSEVFYINHLLELCN